MRKQAVILLFLILGGCNSMTPKAPDALALDLYRKMGLSKPDKVEVIYPAGTRVDSLGQYVHVDDAALD